MKSGSVHGMNFDLGQTFMGGFAVSGSWVCALSL